MLTPTDRVLTAILTSEFPSLSNTSDFLRSMSTHGSFKQGETSEKVSTLLECVQSTDPGSLEIDEDNRNLGWGHDQFMAGGRAHVTEIIRRAW